MNDLPLPAFEHAILAMHGAQAIYSHRIGVAESFEGQPVWEGQVLVFELVGHPTASRVYAWEVDGEVTAVLEEPPVASAADAVRASIMADESVPRG